ncbi:hypothetical protein P5Y53_16160 [Dyella jiangningensis]|uniref:HIT family protein n=1 Tax=Dyella jiangningensis TaxID=1379159 RepID=UPI00241041F6|nr:HIT domain-containing protein [Dyella jiangningensis]MDG2539211.1 hypothetical protein [Dyella jiangningensis]
MPYTTPDRYPCPFCESVAQRLTHVRLFENDHAIAEISDCERTHDGGAILVWPKQHTERVSQLTDRQLSDLAQMIFRASVSLLGAYRPVGMHTFCSAGIMVGQSEAHAHFQIQPRYDDKPYSFAPAGDLPIIKISDRVTMAEKLQRHGSEAPQSRDALSCIRFRDLAVRWPSPRKGIDPGLVVEETKYFVALCHPQSRGPGAVMIMAKRDVRCFLELNSPERTDLLILVRNVARAAESIYAPDGLSIWWDTGEEANHSYSEFVAEVVPRFAGVSYVPEYRQSREHIEAVTCDELAEVVSSYRAKMAVEELYARMFADVDAAHS